MILLRFLCLGLFSLRVLGTVPWLEKDVSLPTLGLEVVVKADTFEKLRQKLPKRTNWNLLYVLGDDIRNNKSYEYCFVDKNHDPESLKLRKMVVIGSDYEIIESGYEHEFKPVTQALGSLSSGIVFYSSTSAYPDLRYTEILFGLDNRNLLKKVGEREDYDFEKPKFPMKTFKNYRDFFTEEAVGVNKISDIGEYTYYLGEDDNGAECTHVIAGNNKIISALVSDVCDGDNGYTIFQYSHDKILFQSEGDNQSILVIDFK